MHIIKQCTLYALTQQPLGEFIPRASHSVMMPVTILVQSVGISLIHIQLIFRPLGFHPGGFY